MTITEEEAELILSTISVTEMEADTSPETDALKERIYVAFPKLGKEARDRARHDYLWSIVVEAHVEVISIRDRIAEMEDCRPNYSNPKYFEWSQRRESLTQALFEAKDRIFKEVLDKEPK